jgi:hypothetical protein
LNSISLEESPAPRKIRHPEELNLPPHDKIKKVLEKLKPQGSILFLTELLQSLEDASNDSDLAPVQLVVDSWYRTLLFRSDPSHKDRWESAEAAAKTPPPEMTIEDVREELGI